MDRRRFLKYTSLGTASWAISACALRNPSSEEPTGDRFTQEAVNFGTLEKTALTLGIVPVVSAIPLIIAQEQGFFERYGLTVSLSKQGTWGAIQDGLQSGKFDGAQGLFGMPLLSQLSARGNNIISLMILNANSSTITLSKKLWEVGIRPSSDYLTFLEFSSAFRNYIRNLEQPFNFSTDFKSSFDYYMSRYWLSAMAIDPDREINLVEIPPSQMRYKLQAGLVDGYCVEEPWNQQAVVDQSGFIAYVNRDLWKGQPGNILATTDSWVEENPTTARALLAAVLEACQFCDQLVNRQGMITTIADKQYLDTTPETLEGTLLDTYNYGGFDEKERIRPIRDLNLFHFHNTSYLSQPNHVNYPWRSYGIWLLTQMIRWNQVYLRDYPGNADERIDQVYPREIYEEVAKALEIEIPSEPMKVEPAEVFVDQRKFDPSDPVAYLNGFNIRV